MIFNPSKPQPHHYMYLLCHAMSNHVNCAASAFARPNVCRYLLTCNTCPFHFKNPSNQRAIQVVSIIVNGLIIVKALINPVLYANRMPEVQRAMQRMHQRHPDPYKGLSKIASRSKMAATSTMAPILNGRTDNAVAHEVKGGRRLLGAEAECTVLPVRTAVTVDLQSDAEVKEHFL